MLALAPINTNSHIAVFLSVIGHIINTIRWNRESLGKVMIKSFLQPDSVGVDTENFLCV